jgi:predicted NAD/FAD-binding protein
MEKLAIIGTGIAGMASSWLLHERFNIQVFEQNDYVGGHTNTAFVPEGGHTIPIDTGFIVCNKENYPLLMRLFQELSVPLKKTDMSFSVQHLPQKLEYCGSSLPLLFVQKKNLFSPRYIKFLKQVNRFNKQCQEVLDDPSLHELSIADYAAMRGLGDDFLQWYILPMSSALWSTPFSTTMQFPVRSLVRFFKNHGLLGLDTQHQWYTVQGGSEVYKQKLIAPFKDKIITNKKVSQVTPKGNNVEIKFADSSVEVFDKVMIATHADQALSMLTQATELQRELLTPFQYQLNETVLHMDSGLMPAKKAAWSSWNYRISDTGLDNGICTYWMNKLQQVSDRQDFFVTLNGTHSIRESSIIHKYAYEHPIFTVAAMRAQERLPELNREGNIFFCGSYFKNGFHEDALKSAVDACREMVKENIWN